jgi:hypothetical protein
MRPERPTSVRMCGVPPRPSFGTSVGGVRANGALISYHLGGSLQRLCGASSAPLPMTRPPSSSTSAMPAPAARRCGSIAKRTPHPLRCGRQQPAARHPPLLMRPGRSRPRRPPHRAWNPSRSRTAELREPDSIGRMPAPGPGRPETVLALATAIGLLAALVQFLGLVRPTAIRPMRQKAPARTPDGARSRPWRRTRRGRSGKAPRTGALGPVHGLVHRLHLEDPVARDQLLDSGNGPSMTARSPRSPSPPPGGAVPAHRDQQFPARRCPRFRVPLDHHPHVVAASWCSQPLSLLRAGNDAVKSSTLSYLRLPDCGPIQLGLPCRPPSDDGSGGWGSNLISFLSVSGCWC